MSIKSKTLLLGIVGLCALLASILINISAGENFRLLKDLFTSWQQRLWPENPSYSDPEKWALPPVYDHSCPFALTKDTMYTGRDPEGANELSRLSGALEATDRALNRIINTKTKIVLAGDSIMRQTFSSLSCLSVEAGSMDKVDQFVRPCYGPECSYSDGRMSFRGGGELIYAPEAGAINTYQWGDYTAAINPTQDWIASCKERKPFQVDTYLLDAPMARVQPGKEANNAALEKVVLTSTDVVVFSAGLHNTRDSNVARLIELLDCIDDAKAQNKTLHWPRIVYLRSSPQHFWSPNGAYLPKGGIINEASQNGEKCRDSIDKNAHARLQEDIEKFGHRIPILGAHLDVESMGSYHIASIKYLERNDCTHWTMPGVPDLYSGEIARWIIDQ